MPKKKTPNENKPKVNNPNVLGLRAAVVEQSITDTLETNYMPYAMSVIVSRAIPEIDGFKPSHRKILYTMYMMGLLNGNKRKSADIVGQTMALNPHGDQAIYETMVRLTRGNGALLVPYVESKGNFGKAYSRDMSAAASRYTEAKLEKVCKELFSEIDRDTVDFVDNYNGQMKEPVLLPVTFPSILTNANTGIAVGMASNICSFNLLEVCETAIARLRDPDAPIAETLKAPDFPGGGFVLYDPAELEKIYTTGRGSVRVRSRYAYDKGSHCVDITEIPPTTTVEAIMDKTVELVKAGGYEKVVLRPMMIVAGDHANNDMADESDDESWYSVFTAAGLEVVECQINGLGEIKAVRDLLADHAKAAVDLKDAGIISQPNPENPDNEEEPKALADGVYSIEVECEQSMFKIDSCELTVQDGQMTAKLVLGSESFDKMFAGNKNAAKLAAEGVVDGVVAGGKATFTLSVAELDKALDYAAHSVKKDEWYDRTLTFISPEA